MTIYIESKNELDDVCRVDSNLRDLCEVSAKIYRKGGTLGLENAALRLTMRQIDKRIELPAQESFLSSGDNFPLLATETMKDTLVTGWKRFVEGIRKIYQRFMSMVKQTGKRLIGLLSRTSRKVKEGRVDEKSHNLKPTNEKYQEQQTETPLPAVKKEDRTIMVPDFIVAYGDETNLDSLADRLRLYGKIIQIILKTSDSYKLNNLIWMTTEENFEDRIAELTQNLIDQFTALEGAGFKGGELKLSPTDTVTFALPTESEFTFLELRVETGKESELLIPADDDFGTFFTRKERTLKDFISSLLEISDAIEKDLDMLNTAIQASEKGNSSIERAMKLVPLLSKRLKFIYAFYNLIEKTVVLLAKLAED